MYRVTDAQIDFILNDIKKRGVEMEDLQLNLLDHVCCMLELNCKSEKDFETEYQKTINQFFKTELWEIEEETIYLLTFKNYYSMRKTMIISGTLAALATIIGTFFKIMHWPGAAILLIIGIIAVGILFLPLLFILKMKEKRFLRDKIVLGLGLLVAVLVSVSALFKIMHWSYASQILFATLALLLIVFIPTYFFIGIRNPETRINTIVSTVLIISGTSLLLLIGTLKPSKQIESASYYADIDLLHKVHSFRIMNQRCYDSVLYTSLDSSQAQKLMTFHKKFNLLFDEVDSIKNILSKGNDFPYKFSFQTYLEGSDEKKWIDYAVSTNWERPTSYFFGEENSNVASKIRDFDKANKEDYYFISNYWNKNVPSPILKSVKDKLNDLGKAARRDFKLFFSPDFDANDIITSKEPGPITGKVDTLSGDRMIQNDSLLSTWEMKNFYHTPQDVVMRNLTTVQLNACIVENAVLLKLKYKQL